MSQIRTATTRTVVPQAWMTVIVYLITRFGITMSTNDWQILWLASPVILGIGYRASRAIEAKWPTAGKILFGSTAQPTYPVVS